MSHDAFTELNWENNVWRVPFSGATLSSCSFLSGREEPTPHDWSWSRITSVAVRATASAFLSPGQSVLSCGSPFSSSSFRYLGVKPPRGTTCLSISTTKQSWVNPRVFHPATLQQFTAHLTTVFCWSPWTPPPSSPQLQRQQKLCTRYRSRLSGPLQQWSAQSEAE